VYYHSRHLHGAQNPLSDLLYSLSMTMKDGVYMRDREKKAKFKLLILDDFSKVAKSEGEKSILSDIIEGRAGTLSTIIFEQRPYNDWRSFIDNPVIADAVLDRLSRDPHHINCVARRPVAARPDQRSLTVPLGPPAPMLMQLGAEGLCNQLPNLGAISAK